MSDTPETDALREDQISSHNELRMSIEQLENHARKLERERNEARAELQLQLNNIAQYDYQYQLHVAERDQLRKVADELAYCLQNPAIFQRLESIEALVSYNSLPHVIERNKSK